MSLHKMETVRIEKTSVSRPLFFMKHFQLLLRRVNWWGIRGTQSLITGVVYANSLKTLPPLY